jgi:ankyrin repeat protein
MAAVESGDVEAVRLAVAAGAGLLDEMEDTSPLALAVEKDDARMVETLLQFGHKPDLGGIVVPLAVAAQNGNGKIAELLLERGANVNEPGEEGETAAMWAAGAGELDMLKRLIKAGADIRQQDRYGGDALSYAVNARQTSTLEFLWPHFPKSRQEKLRRQSHLWREDNNKKESQVAARLQSAMERPASRKRATETLFRAHESGDEKKFLQLLASGADPNETNNEGTTILAFVASFSTVYTLLQPLLKAGADPNCGELFRPLSFAASHGAEPVRMLLKAGANVNWANPDGRTALISAAAAGDEETIRLLLDAGANPNAEDKDGHTAYWHALDCNNGKAAELLARLTTDREDAEKPWRKNKEGKSRELCLIDAAHGGDLEHVKRLLAEGVPVDVADSSGDTALHHAAGNGDMTMIEALLEAGAPIEAEGCADWTPLLTAANRGEIKAVRRLLQAGANVHAGKGDVLCYACEKENSLELVELLLDAGASVNVIGGHKGSTPLHVASEHGQTNVVRVLLQAGAEAKTKDLNGWIPFHNAALGSSVEILRLLIEAGSDIKALDHKGRDACELATQWGKPEVAKFLKQLLGR